MQKRTERENAYQALSQTMQRVVLRAPSLYGALCTPVRSAANQARDLEFSGTAAEAAALRDLRQCLDDLDDASVASAPRCYQFVLRAADRLAACSAFSNPPLNAAWAAAGPFR